MEVYTGEGSLGESSSSLGSRLASPWILNDLEQNTSIHHKDEGLLICKIRVERGSVWMFEDGGQDKSSDPSKLDLKAENWGEEYR